MMAQDPTEQDDSARANAPRFGLSGKLLLLTILFVMIAEVLIYVPSIANFRLTWLADRVAVARTVSIVLNANQDEAANPNDPDKDKFKLSEKVIRDILD